MAKYLVVSVHDVSPPNRTPVDGLLDVLAGLGITRRSLLVIPNQRATSPIDADAGFCEWLRKRQSQGDEIVLHGYEHVGVGTPRGPIERFKNRWYTQDEGEFLTLDYDDALARIRRGAAMMTAAGLDARGFVAPAWLISRDAVRAARASGFDYTNSYLWVTDLQNRRRHLVPSLVFGPGNLNEDVGLALQDAASSLLAHCPIVRVVLHPPCIAAPRITRIAALIRRLAQDRQAITYIDLLGRFRASALARAHRRHAH